MGVFCTIAMCKGSVFFLPDLGCGEFESHILLDLAIDGSDTFIRHR